MLAQDFVPQVKMASQERRAPPSLRCVCYSDRRSSIMLLRGRKIMSTGAEARLQQLGISLPALPTPGGNYVSAKTVGHMVYLSGVISIGPDGVVTGTAGGNRTVAEANAAARACALMHLAVLKRHLGSLDAVKSVVTVN